MSAEVRTASLFLGKDNESIMSLSDDDHDNACRLEHVAKQPNCDVPLYIGVFFDGTNNNRERDEPVRSHTNIVRLFNAHLSMTSDNPAMRRQGHYAVYVPGVGTRFQAIGEWRESMEGKAMGKGAQARILYAVLELVNCVHRAFSGNNYMFDENAIVARLHDFVQCVEEGIETQSDAPRSFETRRSWMRRLNAELQKRVVRARYDRPRPNIPFIRVNVFGFSRGAAQARAFCHWLQDLADDKGKLADMPLQIGFVGLFDCVASVGLSHSVERSFGKIMGFADGHFAWAKEVRLPLPSLVLHTVHMVAAHEQRLNFPVTRLPGGNVTEIVYPGVHSDVGGGYPPRCQGRGATESELLSQVPLAHMHREARRWNVPLLPWEYMDERLQRDFTIAPGLIENWNDYMRIAHLDWDMKKAPNSPPMVESHDFRALVRQHRRLYLNFRWRYLSSRMMDYLLTRQGLPLNDQDYEDISSYNDLLDGDLTLLRQRRKAIADHDYDFGKIPDGGIPYSIKIVEYRSRSNMLPQLLCQQPSSPEDAEIEWALQQFEGEGVPGEMHMGLLTHQVHDSLAGFYLEGFTTPEEMAEKLLEIVQQGKVRGAQSLEPYQRQVYERYEARSKTDEALREMIEKRLRMKELLGANATTRQEREAEKESFSRNTVFTPQEQTLAASVFPLQTDDYARTLPDGMQNAVKWVTNSRREAGGYLVGRAVFEGESR